MAHHEEKCQECPTCGKRFRHLPTMKMHIMLHTGEKPHECEKRFTELGTKEKHIMTHTNEKLTSEKRFTELGTKEKHIMTHTNEKLTSVTNAGKGSVNCTI
ncbi:gastrula zinc finger protein XlCGF57.1-like [Procambarus clarkii]|uniref:gastrula zinc finger protein XlCGF57.1-like n=1 Tax=Procambarus clarkii TaxID=6728 RepID=UPI003742A159